MRNTYGHSTKKLSLFYEKINTKSPTTLKYLFKNHMGNSYSSNDCFCVMSLTTANATNGTIYICNKTDIVSTHTLDSTPLPSRANMFGGYHYEEEMPNSTNRYHWLFYLFRNTSNQGTVVMLTFESDANMTTVSNFNYRGRTTYASTLKYPGPQFSVGYVTKNTSKKKPFTFDGKVDTDGTWKRYVYANANSSTNYSFFAQFDRTSIASPTYYTSEGTRYATIGLFPHAYYCSKDNYSDTTVLNGGYPIFLKGFYNGSNNMPYTYNVLKNDGSSTSTPIRLSQFTQLSGTTSYATGSAPYNTTNMPTAFLQLSADGNNSYVANDTTYKPSSITAETVNKIGAWQKRYVLLETVSGNTSTIKPIWIKHWSPNRNIASNMTDSWGLNTTGNKYYCFERYDCGDLPTFTINSNITNYGYFDMVTSADEFLMITYNPATKLLELNDLTANLT